MHNWGLFYALGGDDRILDYALGFWNTTTRYYEETESEASSVNRHPFYMPQLHNEFWNLNIPYNSDWFHIGEGSQSFYDFGLADPNLEENMRRSVRFAGLYIGEDPQAPNYDPNYRIIRSPYHGSEGPLHRAGSKIPLLHSLGETTDDLDYVKAWLDHASYGGFNHRSITRDWERWQQKDGRPIGGDKDNHLYPTVKNLEREWWNTPQRAQEIASVFDKMALDGDVPENLGATAMVTNAYLYTGDEKYRRWVLDYVEGWIERTKNNGGVIPDNVGPTGKIGEHRAGQWWGGLKGWSSDDGAASNLLISVAIGAESAHLLTGDDAYLDLLRSQLNLLIENGDRDKDGQFVVPMRYGIDGWDDFQPLKIYEMAHLYHASLEKKDYDSLVSLRDGNSSRDWNAVDSQRDRRSGDAEYGRFQYYDGRNKDWPVKIQDAELNFVLTMIEAMRQDMRSTEEIIYGNHWPPKHSEYPSRRDYGCEAANPLVVKGLTQVMTGAPQNIYNGGLQRGSVRYFDLDRSRPGLPLDVAALVYKIESDVIGIQLVNTSTKKVRRLVVQSGVFGEHNFTDIRIEDTQSDVSILDPLAWLQGQRTFSEQVIRVNGRHFIVELPPSRTIRIEAGVDRFANQPSYHNELTMR